MVPRARNCRNQAREPIRFGYCIEYRQEPEVTEDELIASAKAGNMSAYEELVRLYQNLAWKTSLVILRHPADAEDAVQSALVKAWQHLDSFRVGAPFRPWLLRIVANESRNARLHRQRIIGHTTDLPDGAELPGREPGPDTQVIVAERSRQLVEDINRLPDTDREILYAKYVLELSEPEIAEVLGIARGTVKSRLHRSIARLRELVNAEQGGIL
jgi:RNA polymerase sigma-70 factor (ECF subfamily)